MSESSFFIPFVGTNYVSGGIFGHRVMVLGESHYCDEGCPNCGEPSAYPGCLSLTQRVVNDYLDPNAEWQPWMNTFLKFERSLVGRETTPDERCTIWQSILFYNYLQVAMGGPRVAGTSAQYDAARDAFYEILDRFVPDYIIVWGQRLWESLPGDDRWQTAPSLNIEGKTIATGSYRIKGGQCARIMAVNHPSTGYSWDFWHQAITRLFNR